MNGNPDCVALGKIGFSFIINLGTSACIGGATVAEWFPLVLSAGEIVECVNRSVFVVTGVDE